MCPFSIPQIMMTTQVLPHKSTVSHVVLKLIQITSSNMHGHVCRFSLTVGWWYVEAQVTTGLKSIRHYSTILVVIFIFLVFFLLVFLTACFFLSMQDSQLSDTPFTFTPTVRGRDAQYLWRTCTWCQNSEVKYAFNCCQQSLKIKYFKKFDVWIITSNYFYWFPFQEMALARAYWAKSLK